jgi:hypothetical protein
VPFGNSENRPFGLEVGRDGFLLTRVGLHTLGFDFCGLENITK